MPTGRSELTGVALADKIYIIGGGTRETGTTDLVEVYDPRTNEWDISAPLPEKLDHTAAAVYGGKTYVVGGFNENGISTNSLFIYDPITNVWNQGADMPTSRGALTANFVNGTLYAIGGDATVLYSDGEYDPEGVVRTNEAYSPMTNTWTKKSPMPTARDHLSGVVVDEKIYVIGGRQPGKTPLFNDVDANEMYDPKQDNWTSLEPLPTPRSGLAAASVNDNIYILGGESNEKAFDDNERFSPKTNTWISEIPMPTARHGLAAVAIDNKLYVIGGGPEPGPLDNGGNENEIFQTG
jgi:N-acetylneuraminic acid mutarotase